MISSVRRPRSAKRWPSASNSRLRPADADADGEPAAAQRVEAGERVRQPERVVLRQRRARSCRARCVSVTAAAHVSVTSGSNRYGDG